MPLVKSLNNKLKASKRNITAQLVFPDSVPLTQFFNQTLRGGYVSEGVGLYDTGSGDIDLTGQIPLGAAIERAFLYWAVLKEEGVNNPNGKLNNIPIAGELLGAVDIDGLLVEAFRADVTGIANAAVNTLTNFPNSIEPQIAIAFGASLVIIYSSNDLPCKTVIINNGIQGFVDDTVSTILENFNAANSLSQAKTTYIVGDGGGENSAIFNDFTVAGPDAFVSAEGPFWDTLNVDVTGLVPSGATTATASIQNVGFTILFWIAQVFSVTVPACPGRGVKFF